MQIKTPEGDKPLTFYTKNGFDMISYAEFILLAYSVDQMDTAVMMRCDDFMKIAPEQWERFDNFQFFTTPLSDVEFDDLINRARPYNLLGKKP